LLTNTRAVSARIIDRAEESVVAGRLVVGGPPLGVALWITDQADVARVSGFGRDTFALDKTSWTNRLAIRAVVARWEVLTASVTAA
jgi:hypothetical protein